MVTASRALLGVSLLAAAACASGSGGGAESADMAGGATDGVPRLTGSLNPTNQRTGQLAPSGQVKAFGTVDITPAPSGPDRTRVRLTLSAPAQNRTFAWAILRGRCGAPSMPALPIDQFPPLEMSGSGRAQQDVVLPMPFPGDGTYHLAVYWGRGADVGDIMTCANLKRS